MGRKTEVQKKKLQYKKIGGGSARLFLGGRRTMIKPGQRFEAFPEDIPEMFKDTIICMNEETGVQVGAAADKKKVEVIFKVKVRPKNDDDPDAGETKKGKARKWYDVVNKDTKAVMNPKCLTEGDAKKLADGLNS